MKPTVNLCEDEWTAEIYDYQVKNVDDLPFWQSLAGFFRGRGWERQKYLFTEVKPDDPGYETAPHRSAGNSSAEAERADIGANPQQRGRHAPH